MVTAHELSPQMRPLIVDCMNKLKEIIYYLRLFLDEEDSRYVDEAYRVCGELRGNGEMLKLMSGFEDLERNLEALHKTFKEKGDSIDDILYGRLANQAVYIITRANIIHTGLEFKLKRMRKG